ncbi:hypothetical protein LIS82_22000 [Cytobacillus solani]|uniref:hypothetical protein n=1 Tax=Cytobacillus solani TaxID=1637975 RepID=UPI00207AFACB|nr:hypothetical protein [Cytobacillus solani]USK54213.1 hypothetical protein LIS82_22000 [Cytobacillus solani]
MKTLCSECGYQSNLTFLSEICPSCKHDNSSNDYQKGNKFKVVIEGTEHYFRYVDDVIDHVQCNTYFEVDSVALRADLKYLNKREDIELREDCIIERIA